MALRRELLRAEFVGRGDLRGQIASIRETVRVQGNLPDHRIIRDHHGHRPEQHLRFNYPIRN